MENIIKLCLIVGAGVAGVKIAGTFEQMLDAEGGLGNIDDKKNSTSKWVIGITSATFMYKLLNN